jgi:hypothetical protein
MKTNHRSSIPALLLAGLLALHTPRASAASPSELLEKGIYTEETKGDVDSAIAIYQQLLAESKTAQSLTAQALLRLGQCYLKKGRTTEAAATFAKLIKDFPDEKELVAKAREHLPAEIVLGPVPWVDGERQQLTLTLGTGLVIGALELRADLVDSGGKKIWRVGRRMGGTGEMLSSVEVEPETFAPLTSIWKHTLLGEATAVYKPGEVELKNPPKDPMTVHPDKVVFDNEEFMHLMRRLPLEVGYKTTIPTLTSLGGGAVIPVVLEVTARETVEVPAGKFDCFKVPLSIAQTFWISTDAHHYVVKFEGGGATGSLASVSQHQPGAPLPYREDTLGVSFTTPADWVIFRPQVRSEKKQMIALLDPAGDLNTGYLALVQTDSLSVAERQSPRAWAETDFREHVAKELKDAKIRPESWKNVNLGGHLGVSYITDFTENGKPQVGFAIRALGPKTSEVLNIICAPEKFDALKTAFEGIIASYRITK